MTLLDCTALLGSRNLSSATSVIAMLLLDYWFWQGRHLEGSAVCAYTRVSFVDVAWEPSCP